MATRREFLGTAAVGGIGALTSCARLARGVQGKPKRFRTITYNVYACKGWSRPKYESGGMNKPASREHLVAMSKRFADALRPHDADLITLQESPEEWVVRAIAEQLNMVYVYFPSGEKWPGALMTRHGISDRRNCPIIEGERPKDLFTRHWGKAIVETPYGAILVHSAHLHPSKDEIRAREVTEVIKAVEADRAAGQAAGQAARHLIFQGDLNHPPTSAEYPRWKAAGLVDTFEAAGVGDPFTIPADAPKGRIDFVWTMPPMDKKVRETRVLNDPPFRPETPTGEALSDHMPVMATFEMA